MLDYENLEVARDRSKHPRGLKHYNTDSVIESAILDVELALYRLKCLIRGTDHEEENIQNGTETEEEAEEILR